MVSKSLLNVRLECGVCSTEVKADLRFSTNGVTSPDLQSVLLRQQQVSHKVNFPICVSEKNAILVSECSEDMWLLKYGSNFYFGDYGVKESVIN